MSRFTYSHVCFHASYLIYAQIHMITYLISCLWLCPAQIYMFVCMFYDPMPMFMPSHACMLGFVFFHASILTSTCLDVHKPTCVVPCTCTLHAMFVCLGLGLVCHAMCFCSPFVALSFILVFWPISSNTIQTLWSLSLAVHPGVGKTWFVSHTKHTQRKINGSTSFAIDNMYYVNFSI